MQRLGPVGEWGKPQQHWQELPQLSTAPSASLLLKHYCYTATLQFYTYLLHPAPVCCSNITATLLHSNASTQKLKKAVWTIHLIARWRSDVAVNDTAEEPI